jgi:hypothetical protein
MGLHLEMDTIKFFINLNAGKSCGKKWTNKFTAIDL